MAQFSLGGMVFGRNPLIKSIQYGDVRISGIENGNTATINAVVLENSILLQNGQTCSGSGSYAMRSDFVMYELTDETTVTATREHSGSDTNVIAQFCIVEFHTGVLKSNQSGTIDLTSATTNTATITAVDTNKTMILWLGTTNSDIYEEARKAHANLVLTNSTTITATRIIADSSAHFTSYQAVEFY